MQRDGIEVLYTGDGYASLRTEIPQLLVSHDLAFEHFDELIYAHHLRYFRKYAKRFHQTAQSIIAVSQTTKQDIIDTYKIAPGKIKVAGNSTSMKVSDIRDKSISDGADYFIYIGSLNPRKNIVRMIKAFDKFKADRITEHKLVIVGRLAWKSEQIAKALTKARFSDDIIHVKDKVIDVETLISNATALLYPSLFEGFGIPILEGFACDTPVITSNIGSMAEVAQDAAIKIDPLSVAEIANAMYQVSDDPTIREKCINLGRERLSEYSWDKTASTIYQELNNIVNN
jgi:glycosyltransferase involved in cell wall biosynthesis